MRSRSWPEGAALVLGAAADGVWCGALAAALTGSSWAVLAAFAAATIVAGAAVARRFDGGESAERTGLLLALTLTLGAVAVLLVAGRAWTHPPLLWQGGRDLVYVVGLVLLGVLLGRAAEAPDVAVRRAVRAFALLCAILAAAAFAGTAPAWAGWAVATSLLVGGLLVAVVRYLELTELVDPAERMPVWPWMLAVAGAVLSVVAVGALLSLVLGVDTVLWALHIGVDVLRFLLAGVVFVFSYAGAGLLRGIAWVLGLVHLHTWTPHDVPGLAAKPPTIRDPNTHGFEFPHGFRVVGMIVGTVVAIGALLALVAVALRRLRREPRETAMVVEEREDLASLRAIARRLPGRLGQRLRSRLLGLRRPGPCSPAELVRRSYAELERRLTKAGRPRLPGVTVRAYLAEVAAAGAPADAAPRPELPSDQLSDSQQQPAADLADIYELARYSAHAVHVAQAQRFEALVHHIEA